LAEKQAAKVKGNNDYAKDNGASEKWSELKQPTGVTKNNHKN